MNKNLIAFFGLFLSTSSAIADSNLICGVFVDAAIGQPAHRFVANLDVDGDNAALVNADLRFSVYVEKDVVYAGFSRPAQTAKTVFMHSKRILQLLDKSKGESIGWIDVVAPAGGPQVTHIGVCYYTGNETKAPFDP